ncbi:MAG: helix-turn-helix transcriptional regulator [Anaerolineae bacterium]
MTPKKHFKRQAETQFKPGNRFAAKPRWSPKKLTTFAQDVHRFRSMLGFNYSEMGRALGGITGQYVKMIERGERQPSQKITRVFRQLKASPALRGERPGMEALERVSAIWSHVLGKRFKCPECAREVRRGERERGLEYWWARVPRQKHCPEHQRHARRQGKRQGREID